MASGIYAVVHIGKFKLFVGEASRISHNWQPILTQLNSGQYPHPGLQKAWSMEGDKRHFTFHTKQEIINAKDILGIERLKVE